jgi:predicted permease
MRAIQFAIRTLSRTPVLSLAVILSLGLGIGANTAIFSLLNQVLLKELSVRNPHELAVITTPPDLKWGRNSTNNAGGQEAIFSYPMFRELEKNPAGLEAIAAHRLFGANLAFAGKSLSGSVSVVSGGYFPLLGVQPLIGRLISANDDAGAGEPVAVLSYGYWKDRLGGRGDIINQPLRLNGNTFTIVGVTPKDFHGTVFGDGPDVYVPLALKPKLTPGWDGRDKWEDYWLYLLARVNEKTPRLLAEQKLNAVYAPLIAEQAKTTKMGDKKYRERMAASRLKLQDGSRGFSTEREGMRTPMIILICCTGLVLLIASANAANLLLARAAQRAKELAIRVALGAGKRQIMRQLLLEAVLLSLAAGIAGLIVGVWTLDFLIAYMSQGSETPNYLISSRLDGLTLGATLAVSLLTGLLFGLYPAWSAARGSIATTLKDDSGNASAGAGGVRVRRALVCAQVALSMILLIPMGLMLKSLVHLTRTDVGYRTGDTIVFTVSPELNGYSFEQCRNFFQRAEESLGAIPGVQSVAVSMVPLIAGNNWGTSLKVEGYPDDVNADTHSMLNAVGAGFFGKFAVPLIAGREFNERDTAASPKVAVVNERFAEHFFGKGNPVGRRFATDGDKKTLDIEIVGVVKNTQYSSIKQKPPKLYYTPYTQMEKLGTVSFYLRTSLPAEQMTQQVRKVMARLDPDLPLEGMRTFETQIARTLRGDKLVVQLAGAFAALATLLAALGLYGVISYGVTRRRREFGIRIALGAGVGRIRKLVFSEMAWIVAIGVLTGGPAALALARLMEDQLHGVKSKDAAVVAFSIAIVVLASIAAAYMPSRRATKTNPIDALRYE